MAAMRTILRNDRRWRQLGAASVGVLVLAAVLGLTGCDRDPQQAAPSGPLPGERVALPEKRPSYTFDGDLAEQYPEVTSFMRHFLETCLAGDYEAYRRLVTRRANPESRDRFEKILNALQRLTVESIKPVELREIEGPAYIVVSTVEFRPDTPASERHGSSKRIAIVVLEERGEWRMGLAPPGYQPEQEEEEVPTTEPTTTGPSYPWDEDIDY